MQMELSGHHVYVLPFVTLKGGDLKVGMQGAVMQRVNEHFPDLAPRIYKRWDYAYLMRTLKNNNKRWSWRLAEACLVEVWNHPENVLYPNAKPFNPDALVQWLEKNMQKRILDVISQARLLHYGAYNEATHGDCTMENSFTQWHGMSFIDWQPFRHEYIPAHRDVDYGKMLQSVLGWEHVKATGGSGEWLQGAKDILRACPMAWFWAAVHFERIRLRAIFNGDGWLERMCESWIYECVWLRKYS